MKKYFEINNHFKKYLPVFMIMLSILILMGTSYALLRSSQVGENTYVMNVGVLEVSFLDSETNTLTLTSMVPSTDEEGMATDKELVFTVKNTGTIDAKYNIYIEETSTNPEFKTVIRYISNKNNAGYNDPKTLSEDNYIDRLGELNVGESATYKIKAWLKEEADTTYMNKTFTARIVVNARQKYMNLPEFIGKRAQTGIRLVQEANGAWIAASPVLEDYSVRYWSESKNDYGTVELKTLFDQGTINNNVWTYNNEEFSLTITGGLMDSEDGIYASPIIVDNKLWFTALNSNASIDKTILEQTIPVTYVFTDKNDSREFNDNIILSYNDLSEYDYDSFLVGSLFEISGSSGEYDPPEFIGEKTQTGIRLVTQKNGAWLAAYPVLEDYSVKYWSKSKGDYDTVELKTLFDQGTINNNVWTYSSEDFSLTITGGLMDTEEEIYAGPVIVDNKLWFTALSSNATIAVTVLEQTIPLTYVFRDKNASTEFKNDIIVSRDEGSEHDYNSFMSGTLADSTTCLAEGTMITMTDGSKKAVEDLRKGDYIMAYDHTTGKIVSQKVIIVVKTASKHYKNTFVFDDSTRLATINEHGIYMTSKLNKYVNIDHNNAAEYIGESFVSIDNKGNIGTKKLVDVLVEYEDGYKYDIVTDKTLNYVAEDTLSVTHVLVDVINSFEFDDNLMYNKEKMIADIEKYGLYTYEEWEEHCDISVFNEYNIPVMKVGISKGLYTKDYIIGLINKYVLDESVQIVE